MNWMGLNELRESFLAFFESKEHLRLPSFPLIPNNDKSLLLINSGMAPMKKYFTGEEEPPRHRVCTCQKCIRTPDLERVGHTARHGTFFEMLGNFSFGDYFKNEAIPWAWEYLTETLEIPGDKLWPSVYEEDDEAYAIWRDVIGIPEERIIRLGKEDNFWEHGTGPCGPCSEIYFDRGEKYGCGSPDCKPGCDCDRYMEIWNNVFSQFNNMGDGTYTELENKNIDTGMGLERLACVMQGVDNMFEVDTIRRILDTVCEISGKTYGASETDDVSIRVITDHIRSASFMIGDGIIPSNEGRGYVLRRLLRRAARHGKLLGINRPFLSELFEVVMELSGGSYPELVEKHDYIRKVISIEEERFDATIDAGLSILSGLVREALQSGRDSITGEDVFKLYDTFGFPIDLTREIAEEASLTLDEKTFQKLMSDQRERARAARSNVSGWANADKTLLAGLPQTKFVGYELEKAPAKILAILVEEDSVETVSEGDCTIVLDQTPFYGEGGGQVGDTGTLLKDDAVFTVYDTKKLDGVYLHFCRAVNGVLNVGDTVTADIDDVRRTAIRRNHSAAHLLQAALRTVLGTHVEQAGQLVDEERVRFDFTHYAALTPEELQAVENLVNANILVGNPIETIETDVETAKQMGAMALFGEKYGSTVRVVKMGGFSLELCGGTHMDNTARLGLFTIVSEASVAAGVRRIEGMTGLGVLQRLNRLEKEIGTIASELKVGASDDLPAKVAALQQELKAKNREIEALNGRLAATQLDGLLENSRIVNGIRMVQATLGETRPDVLRQLGDRLKDTAEPIVAVLTAKGEKKASVLTVASKAAIERGANAGKLIKELTAALGGSGGGKPDSAMGGAPELSKLDEAMEKVRAALESLK